MARKFINGYNAPVIYIRNASGTLTTIEFDNRYQALNEYEEESWIETELFNGDYESEFVSMRLEWELDLSALLEADNAKRIDDIRRAEREGRDMFLKPHKSDPRIFQVATIKNRRKLGLHYGGVNSPGNKDYVIWFRTVKQLSDPHWVFEDNTYGIETDSA